MTIAAHKVYFVVVLNLSLAGFAISSFNLQTPTTTTL